MAEQVDTSEWNKYQMFVIEELKRLNDNQLDMNRKIDKMVIEQAVDRTRIGTLSAGIAFIISGVVAIVSRLLGTGGG